MCELSRSTSGQLVADPESEHLSNWEQLINRNHLTVWRKPIQNSYLYEYKGMMQYSMVGSINVHSETDCKPVYSSVWNQKAQKVMK